MSDEKRKKVLERIRLLLLVALAVAGPISLYLSPLSWEIVAICVALGTLGGLLCVPESLVARMIGLGILVFGVEAAIRYAAPLLPSLWWQPILVAGMPFLVASSIPDIVRLFSRGKGSRVGRA